MASEEDRREMLKDPFVRSYHDFLAAENFKHFREFIRDKYHLDEDPNAKPDPEIQASRVSWRTSSSSPIPCASLAQEKSNSKMIAAHEAAASGEKVVDIGRSGPGYFSFQFARLVGPKGKVFAVDNNDDHLAYLEDTIKRLLQVPNVEAVMPQISDIGIKDKVDVIYMCSLYHNLSTPS